jgi:hypothetical protein
MAKANMPKEGAGTFFDRGTSMSCSSVSVVGIKRLVLQPAENIH